MGYRNYIGSLPKKEYEKIKNFTKEELYKYKGESLEEDMGYVGVYNIAEDTHYELGKYVDEFDKEMFAPVFLNNELQKHFTNEHDFYIVGKEFLEAVINRYAKIVKSNYDNLLSPFFKDNRKGSEFLESVKSDYDPDSEDFEQIHKFDFSKITDKEQTKLYEMIMHLKSFGSEWGSHSFVKDMKPYDLGSSDKIVTSWKYEYAQFELVRLYKTLDWENNVFIYYGY